MFNDNYIIFKKANKVQQNMFIQLHTVSLKTLHLLFFHLLQSDVENADSPILHISDWTTASGLNRHTYECQSVTAGCTCE